MEILSLSSRMVIEVFRSRACVSVSMNWTLPSLPIPNFRESPNAWGERLQQTASYLVDVDTGQQDICCAQQAGVTPFVAERGGHITSKFGSG